MARFLLLVLAVAAVAAVGPAAIELRGEPDGASAAPEEGRVVEVVDGDTVHVVVGGVRERVRYIGVDTPETRHPDRGVECFGPAASAYNARLVAGARVRLSTDAERRDRYGRLLAYVHRVHDGLFINAELVRLGYAQPLRVAPNERHAARLEALGREARAGRRGLWRACRAAGAGLNGYAP